MCVCVCLKMSHVSLSSVESQSSANMQELVTAKQELTIAEAKLATAKQELATAEAKLAIAKQELASAADDAAKEFASRMLTITLQGYETAQAGVTTAQARVTTLTDVVNQIDANAMQGITYSKYGCMRLLLFTFPSRMLYL